ncbi:LysR family transcriptional regulator [Proteus hauseri]|uniref:LysR family transcriptional regulator n=1 Tax=Proteus cibi TaxID=2050966 RepID=A0ABU6EDM6_9GAMM|nr:MULTISPECIES: LysR family transcriptional regulator [Proteus]MBG6032085.1 LysR family transcriptional regulator [Proteus hauseri]MBS6208966.1 LysR family transcriptional regulator [Proteus hauseri]MEB6856770.1 LysR family transcriptional regulator [Proteus cibi]MEB7087236.1 LysR family transcriptional regulator [Proteus cibi]
MAINLKRTSWSGGWATLRDLEIIQTVIDQGSVTNAAEQLGISQPAVSQTLNQIEKRCGKKLFTRENNKLIPNSDALLLYEEITNIAESFNRLSHFHHQEKKRSLRILVPPTLAYGFINQITTLFIKKYQVNVHLEISRSEQLLSLIAKEQADIVISDNMTINSNYNLTQIPMRETQIICAIPKTHELCTKSVITPDDLHEQSFIALVKSNIGRTVIDRALHKSKSNPNIIAEVSDQDTAMTFVKNGLGVSLINSFPIIETEDIVYREFIPAITSNICFFTSKKTEHETQLYIEFIKEHQPKASLFSTPIK